MLVYVYLYVFMSVQSKIGRLIRRELHSMWCLLASVPLIVPPHLHVCVVHVLSCSSHYSLDGQNLAYLQIVRALVKRDMFNLIGMDEVREHAGVFLVEQRGKIHNGWLSLRGSATCISCLHLESVW